MFSSAFPRSSSTLFTVAAGLLAGLLLLTVGPAQAQAPERAPAQEHRSPSQTGNPAGTGVPGYAEPADPPSSFGSPSTGATTPGGMAQTNAPGTPNDPSQVPLGGAEWLAAAGAAYAIKRLRDEEEDEDEA